MRGVKKLARWILIGSGVLVMACAAVACAPPAEGPDTPTRTPRPTNTVKPTDVPKPTNTPQAAAQPTATKPRDTSALTPTPRLMFVVATTAANVRAKPESNAQIVVQLPRGAQVQVYEMSGEWYRVQSAQVPGGGWIAADLLSEKEPEPLLATSTPVPAIAEKAKVTAWVSNQSPAQNSDVTVYGKFTIDGVGVAGVPMTTRWRYKSETADCSGTTGNDGVAACTRQIGRATKGYTVQIEIRFTYEGKAYSAVTEFTPR